MTLSLKDPTLFHQQACIDGAWIDADSRQVITVTNPATSGMIGTVPDMGVEETRRAITAAEALQTGMVGVNTGLISVPGAIMLKALS